MEEHNQGMHMEEAALHVMMSDILERILEYAENPGQLAEYLTRQMKELLGARAVALIHTNDYTDRLEHSVMSVCPERRRKEICIPGIYRMAELCSRIDSAEVWSAADSASQSRAQGPLEAQSILAESGWKDCIALPLTFGSRRFGCMFLLGLVEGERAAGLVGTIEILTHIIALVLKNSMLFEEQDKIIEQRTKELLRKERKYQTLADLSPVGIIRADMHADCIYVNQRWREITGLDIHDALGKAWLDCVHPADRGRVESSWLQAGPGRALPALEFRVQRASGEVGWIFFQNAAERDDHGRISGYVGTWTDISDRKIAEEKLSQEMEKLDVTLRSIGEGVIATDVSGALIRINQAAERLTGWAGIDALGRPLAEVFPLFPDSGGPDAPGINAAGINAAGPAILDPLEAILGGGESIALEDQYSLQAKDGSRLSVSFSGAPIRDRAAKVIGAVLVFRDARERRRLAESLQREQRLESLGILAGGIAHDFNNLLAGLFGFIDMAADAASRGKYAEVSDYLTRAMGAFNRARALTHQLLTFSKGGQPIRSLKTLGPLLSNSAQFALAGSSCNHVLSIAEGLWSCECDENQIGQVVDNIIINAKQAMPLGGTIQIDAENIRLSKPGALRGTQAPYVRMRIRDQGIGIPKEIIDHIYDPFFSTKESGHGLGLATAFSIVQRHGGWIDVESEPGKGSCFSVYLPAYVAAGVSEFASLEVKPRHQGQGRVLVMDDEDFIRDLLRAYLQEMGYEVLLAKDGDSALAGYRATLAESRPFNFAILDLTIPGGMGGVEAAKSILALDPAARLVAASGYSQDPVMADPSAFGFRAKLEKPFRSDELETLVARIEAPIA